MKRKLKTEWPSFNKFCGSSKDFYVHTLSSFKFWVLPGSSVLAVHLVFQGVLSADMEHYNPKLIERKVCLWFRPCQFSD